MSKYIDPNSMSPADVEYVRQRPTLHREFQMQGLGDPLVKGFEGHDFDWDEEYGEKSEEQAAEQRALQAEQEAEQAKRDADEARIAQEEAERLAAEGQGSGPDDTNHNSDTPVETDELPAEKQWKKSQSNDELQNVVNARNADYDEDEQISVKGTGKDGKVKHDDLVAALEQDDRELAGDPDEE